MKTAAISFIALSLVAGAATTAAAAAERLSDVAYLQAARCKGIAEGLGNVDTAAVTGLLKKEEVARVSYIQQQGESEVRRGKRDAKRENNKAELTAELNGACAAYLGANATVAETKATPAS